MRITIRMSALSAALLPLLTTACAGTTGGATTATSTATTAVPSSAPGQVTLGRVPTVNGAPLQIYRGRLSAAGEPHGTGAGGGYAIVALHRGSMVCFRFAHLTGLAGADGATLGAGGSSRLGSSQLTLSGGPHLAPEGCVAAPAGIYAALAKHPNEFSVNITTVKSPQGAVKARL